MKPILELHLNFGVVSLLVCDLNSPIRRQEGIQIIVKESPTPTRRIFSPLQTCCDNVAGCFCEFGCNLMYDVMLMVSIVMWMVPVTWWVFRSENRLHCTQLWSVLKFSFISFLVAVCRTGQKPLCMRREQWALKRLFWSLSTNKNFWSRRSSLLDAI